MLITPVITKSTTYVAVVKSKNEPRRLNSLACELDSIRLVNIRSSVWHGGPRVSNSGTRESANSPVPSGRGRLLRTVRHRCSRNGSRCCYSPNLHHSNAVFDGSSANLSGPPRLCGKRAQNQINRRDAEDR